MSNLITKQVNFQNVNMTACKTNEKVFVGIRSICDGLGIAYNGQMERINRDDVLPEGVRKIRIPTSSGDQETNMLDIEYLPFFLIGIKSSMCKEEIRPKLKEFKLKAKDVLAAAFIKKQLSPMEQLRLQYQVIESHEEKINELDTKVKNLALTMNITDGQAKTIQKLVNKRVKTLCCGNESSAYMDQSIRKRVYSYIWRTLKDYLNVSVYHNILRKDYSSAIKYIDTITLQGALFREVQEINQQINIKEAAI
ncbi:ORF6C domain-containing protein [Clostridium sp. HV4-5-A1G]|uniref:ORF6C domain-containing protein n=2 Tax=unclassified Clostridium TaxID=2614128 RepID=UPI001687BE56|nr:ORF6C domain-containing protein [Clostridium sp. HV4-5-A1G]